MLAFTKFEFDTFDLVKMVSEPFEVAFVIVPLKTFEPSKWLLVRVTVPFGWLVTFELMNVILSASKPPLTFEFTSVLWLMRFSVPERLEFFTVEFRIVELANATLSAVALIKLEFVEFEFEIVAPAVTFELSSVTLSMLPPMIVE